MQQRYGFGCFLVECVLSVFSRALRFLVNMVNESVDCVASKSLSFLLSVTSSFGSGVPLSIFLVSSSVMSSSLPVCVMTSLFAGQGAWHFMQPISVLWAVGLIHFGSVPSISLYRLRHFPALMTKFSWVMAWFGQFFMQILQFLQIGIISMSFQLSGNSQSVK